MQQDTHVQTPARAKASNNIEHAYCCDRTISWCGLDVTDIPEVTGPLPADGCVVCFDAMTRPCPICGE